jgi:hypothetical protein
MCAKIPKLIDDHLHPRHQNIVSMVDLPKFSLLSSTLIFHVTTFDKRYLLLPIVLKMNLVDGLVSINTTTLKRAFL